jgi:hypothetical protein
MKYGIAYRRKARFCHRALDQPWNADEARLDPGMNIDALDRPRPRPGAVQGMIFRGQKSADGRRADSARVGRSDEQIDGRQRRKQTSGR